MSFGFLTFSVDRTPPPGNFLVDYISSSSEVSKSQVMEQTSVFVCASVHLGDLDFSSSIDSRGKQWALMSLSALISEQLLPIQQWNSKVLDTDLLQGDAMYRHSTKWHVSVSPVSGNAESGISRYLSCFRHV